MEAYDYLKFVVALVFVLSLMGGLAYVMKRLGMGQGMSTLAGGKRRLKILEVLPLDSRRKLMMIERDDVQHLVILSSSGETVVETNIKGHEKGQEHAAV
ncbi:MAG: FliO/MopB family protein [Alphaproteobacteria bacterium]|nr:FliO/MopB family protein [Alphaproteobacteria bacterium]